MADLETLTGIGISQNAIPTRTRKSGKPRDPHDVNHNSWEKGIAKDERGMPFLDKNLEPVGVKEYAEKRNTGLWDRQGTTVS